MNLYRIIFLSTMLFASTILLADTENIKTIGTTTVFIPQTNHLRNDPETMALGGKYIVIETVELSAETQRLLEKHIKNSPYNNVTKQTLLHNNAGKIALGMNHVPVLDQGAHRTCATFSTTAAIDAVLGEDLISQLCYLELTNYLSQVSSHSNGWKGSRLTLIFNDLKKYGVISKTHQTSKGCAGVYEYPVHDKKSTGKPMTIDEYTRYSQKTMDKVEINNLLSDKDAFSDATAAVKLVTNVKSALERGNRVVISMLLDTNYKAGIFGSYKAPKDAWIITPDIKNDILEHKVKGRHGLIVTGYDDKAIISGPNNTRHEGVFTVRNSWGPQVGDHGDFYVSYEYLHSLAYRANEITVKP